MLKREKAKGNILDKTHKYIKTIWGFQSCKIETCTDKENHQLNNPILQTVLKDFRLHWSIFFTFDYRQLVKTCLRALGQSFSHSLLPKFSYNEAKSKKSFHCLPLKAANNVAFTLAEVLIVIGIIGVVANMTIPTLMNNVQEKSLNTAWRKSFSTLSSTAQEITFENSGRLTGLFSDGAAGKTAADSDVFRNVFLEKMKAVKVCDVSTTGCWADEWYSLGKSSITYPSTNSRATLADGTFIYFDVQADPDLCNSVADGKNTSCGNIAVDVNGSKKPNMVGKDIFGLWVSSSGKIGPVGTSGDFYYGKTNFTCDVNTYPSTTGWNCSADYLFK